MLWPNGSNVPGFSETKLTISSWQKARHSVFAQSTKIVILWSSKTELLSDKTTTHCHPKLYLSPYTTRDREHVKGFHELHGSSHRVGHQWLFFGLNCLLLVLKVMLNQVHVFSSNKYASMKLALNVKGSCRAVCIRERLSNHHRSRKPAIKCNT